MNKDVNKLFVYLFMITSFLLLLITPTFTVAEAKGEESADKPVQEKVIFDFEKDIKGWEIPAWEYKREDYAAKKISMSANYASEGKSSLEVKVDFPGKPWKGAYVEYGEYFNWKDYSDIAVDVYIPKNAPQELKGKIILSEGEDWVWVEMMHPVKLMPGEWVTIRANLLPGSTDWVGLIPDDAFRMGIRTMGVRVEDDKAAFKGSFYVDNIIMTPQPYDKVKETIYQKPGREKVLFGFEGGTGGWEIPEWVQDNEDYVAEKRSVSKEYASEGNTSLGVKTNFAGGKWAAAYIENAECFDWVDYSEVAADIYLPQDAPPGLMGKIILVVGDDWEWVEMKTPRYLIPGEWVTVRANLMPGSTDWKGVNPDDGFRMDIRKIGLRVSADKKPIYKGSFYVDNIRLTILEGDKAKKAVPPPKEEKVIFGFEKDIKGWEIPQWALEEKNYVAETIARSDKYTNEGKNCLEIKADFPGDRWTAAYVEYAEYFNWKDYSDVAIDVYIPKDTPAGLRGKIILAAGDDWQWVEMRRPVVLVPGEWVTIRANLMPGSTDWRGLKPDEEFRMDIRKLGIRIESDKKPAYKGSVYADNIRLAVLEADKPEQIDQRPRQKKVIFGFEKDSKGWSIPDWVIEQDDYVTQQVGISKDYYHEGKRSLEVKANFPGKKWAAAYVEYADFFNWRDYSDIEVDIYLPQNTPDCLMGKIILGAGEDYKWVEMMNPVRLVAGEWVTIRANLMPGSTDWKGIKPGEEFRRDIRKLIIRVETDKPSYKGSFYIDNIEMTVLPSDKGTKAVPQIATSNLIFSFEKDTEDWDVPDWVKESKDYVAGDILTSGKYASEGKSSLEVGADFPGSRWTAVYVECVQNFDWTEAWDIAADIYVPKSTPPGLMGKIVLTTGEEWKWREMKYPVPLNPGEWMTIEANLRPGSIDWKGMQPDDAFRKNIKKIGIKIYSDKKPVYKGSIYIDNIRTISLKN
ncbi:MAG: hypothetical protein V1653_03140 [bacterium]